MQSSSYRTSTVVIFLFVCLCSNAVIFPGKADGIAAALAPYRNVESRLTIIARADGTFDIKEFPQRDRWFAPEVVGAGLAITGERRFGRTVKPSSVDVLVKADAGARDEVVKAALSSARASGFTRFSFVDPRLGEVVKRFATINGTETYAKGFLPRTPEGGASLPAPPVRQAQRRSGPGN